MQSSLSNSSPYVIALQDPKLQSLKLVTKQMAFSENLIHISRPDTFSLDMEKAGPFITLPFQESIHLRGSAFHVQFELRPFLIYSQV